MNNIKIYRPIQIVILLACASVSNLYAQWNQTTSGNYGYTSTANWVGGTVNNVFTNLSSAATETIQFGGNYSLTTPMLISSNNANLTFESSNSTPETIQFSAATGIVVTNPTGGTITVGTVANPLILDLNGNNNCIIGGIGAQSGSGNLTMNVNAQITDSSGHTNGINVAGDRVFTYLLNSNNNFVGPVTFTGLRGGGFSSIGTIGGGASALGAPTDSTNGLITVKDGSSNGTLKYSGSGNSSDRSFFWNLTDVGTLGNAYQFENAGSGKLTLAGLQTMPTTPNTEFIVNAVNGSIEFDGCLSETNGFDYIQFTGSGSTNQIILNNPTNTFAAFELNGAVTLAYNTISNAGSPCSLGTNGNIYVKNGCLQYNGTNSFTTNNRAIYLVGTPPIWSLDNGTTNTLSLNNLICTNLANSITNLTSATNTPAGARTLDLDVFTAADAGPYGTLQVPSLITDASSTNIVQVVASSAVGYTVFNGGTVSLLNPTNTFSGGVLIKYNRTLQVMALANSNSPSSIGLCTNPPSGYAPITFGSTDSQRGGILSYIGTNNASCNEQIAVLGSTGGANNFSILNNSPNNSSLTFTAPNPLAYKTATMSNCLVTLGGSAVATNTFDLAITNTLVGEASLVVSGSYWIVQGQNTYFSNTTVSAGGTLVIGGAGYLGGGAYSANILNNGTFVYNSSAAQTLSGVISGSGMLIQDGSGTLTLSGANTYTNTTTINGGTLALGTGGSIYNSTNISIASGATFDVSALSSPYTFSTTNTLSAAGTGTTTGTSAAAIKGASGGTVSLGSQPITLTYDGSHPALYISQGTLSLNGNAFTVNSTNGTGLAVGSYTVAQQVSGNISSSGSYTVTGNAVGAGKTGSISVSSGNIILTLQNTTTLTLTRTAGASPSTYGSSLTFQAVVSPDPGNGSTITFLTNGASFGTATTTSGTATLSTSTLPYSGGSAYTVTASFGGNPTNTASSGTLSGGQQVNALAVTLSGSRNYDGTANAAFGNLLVANAANGDTVDVASGTGTLAGKNVGSESISSFGTLALGNNSAGDYTLTGYSGSMTINATNITVTAASNSKTYDGTTNAAAIPSITAGGLQGSDTANFTESYASPNVGTSLTLTPAGTVTDGNSGNNYAYTFVPENIGTILAATNGLAVNSSENPSGYNDTVIFTALVQTNGVTAGDATGNVLFLTNGVLSDTEPLSNGTATTTNSAASPLPHGTDSTITAQYAGDQNYIGNTNSLVQVVTNHIPMACVMTAYRTAGETLKVALSDIATNWSDSNGIPVELMGVNLLTTNAQTLVLLNVTSNMDNSLVIISNSFVGYTNGPNVADQFSYSIADSFGGTNIGFVNIVILTNLTGQATGLINPGGSAVTVNFAGWPGYSYTVQRATNMVSPVWATILTTNAPSGGLFNYTDSFTDLGGVPSTAYYRLSWQP